MLGMPIGGPGRCGVTPVWACSCAVKREWWSKRDGWRDCARVADAGHVIEHLEVVDELAAGIAPFSQISKPSSAPKPATG